MNVNYEKFLFGGQDGLISHISDGLKCQHQFNEVVGQLSEAFTVFSTQLNKILATNKVAQNQLSNHENQIPDLLVLVAYMQAQALDLAGALKQHYNTNLKQLQLLRKDIQHHEQTISSETSQLVRLEQQFSSILDKNLKAQKQINEADDITSSRVLDQLHVERTMKMNEKIQKQKYEVFIQKLEKQEQFDKFVKQTLQDLEKVDLIRLQLLQKQVLDIQNVTSQNIERMRKQLETQQFRILQTKIEPKAIQFLYQSENETTRTTYCESLPSCNASMAE